MPTRDLTAFAEDDGLRYPGITSKAHPEGHTYTVASPSATDGLRLAAFGELAMLDTPTPAQAAKLKLDDDEEFSLYRLILGPTLDEMEHDGVSWPMLRHIAQDAFRYWAINEDFADVVLASQGEAVALANRATRRAQAKQAKKAPAKKAATTRSTPRSSGGSKSSPASTPTPARTRKPRATTRAAGRSSTSPSGPAAEAATA